MSTIQPIVLVLGGGKSGTTALYERIRNALAQNFGITPGRLFEPRESNSVDQFLNKERIGVAKILYQRFRQMNQGFLPRFSHRVFICRDPRDNIVSQLMWNVATRRDRLIGDPQFVIDLFRKKETDPSCMSLLELYRQIDLVLPGVSATSAIKDAYIPAEFFKNKPNVPFFLYRYEDMIYEKFHNITQYLEFDISGTFKSEEKFDRIKRSASSGYWKDWFLPEDDEFFSTSRREDLELMGYEIANSTSEKTIDPSVCSHYITRLWNDTNPPGK